jgi:drug/metabolite transporter (DMT)-like permease
MQHSNRLAPYWALSLAVLFWGLSFVATKIALKSFAPSLLIFARFSIAACFFLGAMWHRGFPSLPLKEHAKILLAALFQPGLYFLFETTGLQHTSASKASLIVAAIPITVLVLSTLFLKERLSLLALSGIGISFVGAILLVVGDPETQWALEGPMLGDLFIFGAVVSMALYTIIMKQMIQSHSTLNITGLQTCYGALLFAAALFWDPPKIQSTDVNAPSLIALICLTLFATIGAFFCYNYALARLSASRTALFLNCVPVVTTIGAWAVLGERLTFLQIFGGALVLASVYLISTLEKHPPELSQKAPIDSEGSLAPRRGQVESR